MSTSFSESGTGSKTRQTISRRDYWIVGGLIIGTVLVLLGGAEVLTRIFWPQHQDEHTCVMQGPFDSKMARPNCSVRTKTAEGPWVDYHYNECGFRTFDSCGTKPPGTFRIAFLGSSYTQGMNVRFEDSFAQRTTHALADAWGVPVQDENLGFETLTYLQIYQSLDRVIALRPDLIVWSVAPFDVEEQINQEELAHRNDPSFTVKAAPATFDLSLAKRIAIKLQESRAAMIAQHFLFENTDTYVRLSWARGDKTDYLRDRVSPRWTARYHDLELVMTDAAARLKRAGIPLIFVTLPSHQIAALLTTKNRPEHSDPFAFGREIGRIAKQLDIAYVDTTIPFSKVPRSDHLFYLFESHLDAEGNEVVARALAEKCLDGSTISPILAARSRALLRY